MKLSSPLRIMKFAFQDFGRNIWLSVATISVLVLTLVSVNLLLVMNVLGKAALSTVESKIDVSVHFKPEVEESRVQTMKIALLSMPEVKDVIYISPAESLTRFSDTYKKDAAVIESLGEVSQNPFGATLVVRARSLEGYSKVLAALNDPMFNNIIDEKDFDDPQAMIARVKNISVKIEEFAIAMSALFGLITLLIVYNTIRVCIYTHREEIGIMRLVGASDGFIRGPYYVEAIIWSVVALAACLALTYPALGFAQPFLKRFFGADAVDLLAFYNVNFFRVFGLQLFAVSFMAVLTTKMATSRYLKV